MALTAAAERFLENPQRFPAGDDTAFLAFWCPEPFTALVVAEPSLGNWFWPAVFGSAPDRDFRFSVATAGGRALFGAAPDRALAVEQTLQVPGLSIRLAAWPKDARALYRQSSVWQNFYLGMIGAVVALLAFGSYLAVRTVRAELAVAQMKAGFVSTVSHEFRSPLAGINQLAEMLRDGRVKDDERRQQYYEMIVNETHRLRRLVESVLDFSRMEEGRKQYRFQPFDTARWLAETTGDFGREVATSGFDLATAIPADLPPWWGTAKLSPPPSTTCSITRSNTRMARRASASKHARRAGIWLSRFTTAGRASPRKTSRTFSRNSIAARRRHRK